MDPLTIAALLASLAKLGGALAGAFATSQSGQPLSDDQKTTILAAQRLAEFENDRAISDALNRAAGRPQDATRRTSNARASDQPRDTGRASRASDELP